MLQAGLEVRFPAVKFFGRFLLFFVCVLAVLGVELGASHVLGRQHSTTELYLPLSYSQRRDFDKYWEKCG